MCELCRHNPCSSGCPNAPEEEPVFICDSCEEGIFAGEEVYEIDGHKYCEGCINDARYTAEAPEPYEPDPDRIYDDYRDRQLSGEAEYIISQNIFGGD